MPPVASFQALWDVDPANPYVAVDCLLPTGVLVPIQVDKGACLAYIKEELWKEARHYPLFPSLKDRNSYVFMCINQMAEKEELVDESKRLNDVQPFQAVLKLVEKKGDRTEKILNSHISILIGKGLHEFDSLKSDEVQDFRKRMKKMCEGLAKERDNKPWLDKVLCAYPPDVAPEAELPTHLQDKLPDSNFRIAVRMENTSTYTFRIPYAAYPEELIDMALLKRSNTTGQRLGLKSNYVLKVCGREEYLLGGYPISQFQYMRKMVAKDCTPTLVLVSKADILEYTEVGEDQPPIIPPRHNDPHRSHPPPVPLPKRNTKDNLLSTWKIEDNYQIKIESVHNVHCESYPRLAVRAGLFHGPETLCDIFNTREATLMDNEATWNDECSFGIKLIDLPRMARLCLSLYAIVDRKAKTATGTRGRKVKQGKQEMTPLAWVNIPVFDYKDILRTGQRTLHMWPFTDYDMYLDDILNPIGTVECNPDADEASAITITFHQYDASGPIYYPPFDLVIEVAARTTQFNRPNSEADSITQSLDVLLSDSKQDGCERHLDQLRQMVERDPLNVIHDQEQSFIWKLRYECLKFPHSLPKLLSCVDWGDHVAVAQMQSLLQIWPILPPTQALELLDFAYADKAVRKYAIIKCLQEISDTELSQYILQLIQVLKYESYLDCDLVEFLLKRALNNKRIGHMFFWLLRSEMHVPSVAVRFGLILEAYCRGNISHMKSLNKQLDALGKLRAINVLIKSEQYKDIKSQKVKDKAKADMKMILEQNTYTEVLSRLHCPLEPALLLSQLKLQNCRFMDSKMRPLWLVWENQDSHGDDIYMMYKNGDDLRQDMLTLQMLRIMDNIWQAEGLDLRLNVYGCLSTGQKEGLIELVLESQTIANIQSQYSGMKFKSAFNKESLFRWILEHNMDGDSLNKAVEEFTLSCAGYCVATYVLGIGDRHSDNIMLKRNGQLFHIDFGHFLGHFKSKFGVKRERVPFVLTSDFVYVIKKGPENIDSNFRRFKQQCEDAFLALRRKANFLIVLLMMMMNTGIPELSSIQDIHYLRDTLVPHLTEAEAKKHFQTKFQEALKNSWKTSVNWAVHNLAKAETG